MVLSVVSLYQLPPVKFTSCLLPIASKPKKQFLSLKKKVEVIRAAEENRGISIRELGERFNCGKTQLAKILKDKESLLSLHSRNISSTRVITGGRKSEYDEINKTLYDWYTLACSKNVFPAGPQLIEKAKQIAAVLGKSEFKGSRSWLDKWKKGITSRIFESAGTLAMFRDPLLISGRKGYLKF